MSSIRPHEVVKISLSYPPRMINSTWYEPRMDMYQDANALVVDFAQHLSRGGYPTSMLSLTSAHSGTPGGWVCWLYETFADLDVEDKWWVDAPAGFQRQHPGFNKRMAASTEVHISTWLVLRDDLSYQSDLQASDFANLRFISMEEVCVRPGHLQQFEQLRRSLVDAYAVAEIEEPVWVYESYSGGPTESFQIWTAYRDIGRFDFLREDRARVQRALADGGHASIAAETASSICASKTTLFGVHPAASYPPPELVSANPTFWQSTAPPWP